MQTSPFLHEIGIVSVMKNEEPYVKEWIDYHMAAGVTKFYLYDNESEGDFKEILRPYIEENVVEYTFFPGQRPQMPAFNDALQKHRFDCHYITFVDADEFICPRNGQSIFHTVQDIMRQDAKTGGVLVDWYMFGSSGHEKMDLSKGCLERFVHRAEKTAGEGKCIVNPRCVDYLQHPHNVYYYEGRYSINESGMLIGLEGKDKDGTADKICINHYHTKSKEEWVKRKQKGDVYFSTLPYVNEDGTMKMEAFERHDCNDVYDDYILKYWEERKGNAISVRDNASFILGCLNQIAEFAEKDESILSLESFLCYWHACYKYMSEYLNEGTIRHFGGLLLKGLDKVLKNVHEVWEVQLFLSVVPDLMRASKETKPVIVKYSKIFIPQLMQIYRNRGDFHHYCRVKKQLEYLETL